MTDMILFDPGRVTHRQPERWIYTVPTGAGEAPEVVSVKVFDITAGGSASAGTDVSATKLSGDATVEGGTITLPAVVDIEPGRRYRLEVVYDKGDQRWAPICYIEGKH